jgi:GDPmannose 4,6-dehydratase
LQDKLFLGNLDAIRDWGYAPEYVEAMWLMLQSDEPDDFVVATGEATSVRGFLDSAFGALDLDWKSYVEIDPIYLRPTEVDALIGDASKVVRTTGWRADTQASALAEKMALADINLLDDPAHVDQFKWRY